MRLRHSTALCAGVITWLHQRIRVAEREAAALGKDFDLEMDLYYEIESKGGEAFCVDLKGHFEAYADALSDLDDASSFRSFRFEWDGGW